jgi:DNA primase
MESQVEQIKDKLSINEVVGQYIQLKKAGRNFYCPLPVP